MIDPSSMGIIATSLSMARDIAKTAMAVRDFNQFAAAISQINDQLLKAQDGLLAHNAQLFGLQQQLFEATQKVQELEEAARDRDQYSLWEITPGNFAYRVKLIPDGTGASGSDASMPLHYLCQPCFGRRVKAVLGRKYDDQPHTPSEWQCPVCKNRIEIPGTSRPINSPDFGHG